MAGPQSMVVGGWAGGRGRSKQTTCWVAYILLLLFSHQVMSKSETLWTVAHQAPLSMGFPRQEYCSGLLFPSPEDLPEPRIKHISKSALAGRFFTTEPPGKPILLPWDIKY